MKRLFVDLKENSYEILIEKGILGRVGTLIKDVFKEGKIFIITDENVDTHYGKKVEDSLLNEGFIVDKVVLKPGEETKSFNTLPLLYNKLLDFKLTRKDLIITLGGGVVGDLGGFVASTFLRGIPFIQIPTSLLAQVDSSVGGKVAVDLERGKNLVGSFYQPKMVLIDPEVLNTLEDRYFRDGLGEVIKYGLIRDENLYGNLKNYSGKEEVLEHIEEIIYKCCNIKRIIVERDERDLGERMVLNFGHTIGHAVEKYYDFKEYTHGECVAIGMYNILKLSEVKGISKNIYSNELKELLIKYKLPYEVEVDNKEILETITLDKKNMGKVLKAIIVKEIGKGEIYDTTVEFFK
ncbi:3-dehydroquinate synthase [uncultured Clostridium sp.]|uniref:3-dehydroquinate synthase n=1 Tax=uncultured Clostridium sp. TaxID=59620 RepID=UPI002618A8A8|nr:3-dehydroquinate synthase [uncultured Clostridium sp.]